MSATKFHIHTKQNASSNIITLYSQKIKDWELYNFNSHLPAIWRAYRSIHALVHGPRHRRKTGVNLKYLLAANNYEYPTRKMLQPLHWKLPGHPPYSPELVPDSTSKEFLNWRQNWANASVWWESRLSWKTTIIWWNTLYKVLLVL